MSDFDLAAYLDLFREDVAEHLQRMTAGLLALEADPSDRQSLDDLFRSAHTVKGSARMMALGDIATLAHRMEDVLSAFRSTALEPAPARVSLLFAGLDVLKRMVDIAGTSEERPPEYDHVLAGLTSALAAHTPTSQPPASPIATAAPADPQHSGASVRQREYVRVPVAKVDQILNLAGELAIHRAEGQRHVAALKELSAQVHGLVALLAKGETSSAFVQVEELARQLDTLARRQRSEASWRSELTFDLHAEITRIRMFPLNNVFGLFQRAVRDLSLPKGKEVRLVTEGGDIEIDKLILEGIQEPLLHLVRNAVDHGIGTPAERERNGKPRSGTVAITARQQGDRVEISVSDDGRGLNIARIREVAISRRLMTVHQVNEASEDDLLALLFRPGFSTSEQVTETSGRGVGMDVVRAAAAELGGLVTLHSRPNAGTTCVISLPLTLAYTRALLVLAGDQTFALPSASLELVLSIQRDQVSWLQAQPAVEATGRTVPLLILAEALRLPHSGDGLPDTLPIVVIRSGGERVAFLVERLLGEDDIVAKSLGPMLKEVHLVSGGAILPDGGIALLVNTHHLVESVILNGTQPPPTIIPSRPQRAKQVLVVDDVSTTRELERTILTSAGYRVDTAVDGIEALEKLSEADYDAVITDVEMPRMDGFELTETLRRDARLRGVPVVIVTTRESEDDRRRGLEAGAQAYLLKGAFDQHGLIEVLERLVG